MRSTNFGLDKVSFLGHMIYGEGVLVDPQKFTAIVKWGRPNNMQEI